MRKFFGGLIITVVAGATALGVAQGTALAAPSGPVGAVCAPGQQLGSGSNVPIIGGILDNLDATAAC
jgi:hypothetical protein